MRKVILLIQVTLDGFIEGSKGEMDWMSNDNDDSWQDLFNVLRDVDTFLLGRKMYPGYADYWRSVLTKPSSPKNEMDYAQLADKTQHIVFSNTMEKADWQNTRIVTNNIAEEIAQLKQQPGKHMMLLGGAGLASAFINHDLVDEYHISINPVILGSGLPLFKNIDKRHQLKLMKAKTFSSGVIECYYEAVREK